MLNKFTDDAARAAAAKLTTESGVDLIESSNEVIVDGANVIVSNPKVGDILVLDESNKKRYIALDTYKAAVFPAAWTIVGVVAHRQGNKIIVVHKQNASKKWSEVFRWYLAGSTMTDGKSHTQNFTFNSVSVSVTWSASTLSAFATALNGAISGQDFGGHSLRAYYDDDEDKVFLIWDTYNTWKEPTMSGISFNRYIGTEIEAVSNIYGLNGVGSEYKGINFARYKAAVKNSSSSIFNPTTPITSLGTYPLSYASYSSNIGAYARNIYGEGEDAYDAYLADYMVRYPSQRGALKESLRAGKTNTYSLVGKMYVASDGTEKSLYPAAEYCAAVGYNADGLAVGSWYLPSMYEIIAIWSKLTYGLSGVTRATADAVNRSLNAIGGSAVSCAGYAWSSCRCHSRIAWRFNGTGCTGSNHFYDALAAVPCVLLDVSD